MKKFLHFSFIISCLICTITISSITLGRYYFQDETTDEFNATNAFNYVKDQVRFGPRTLNSDSHDQFLSWLKLNLYLTGWETIVQTAHINDQPVTNIIAKKNNLLPELIIAAHYDSRLFADKDPDPAKHKDMVMGANDGASGVAVLLELSRIITEDIPVWLVFFDAEDNGRINGLNWSIGSRMFVEKLEFTPSAVIIVDMVGDEDLNIMIERNSTPRLVQSIWNVAKLIGFEDHFIPELGYAITDDHLPFIEVGIPAIDIIDFDYPYWHTTQDTIDKITPDSLEVVGKTLQYWINNIFPDRYR